jgi:hypothetical protein
MKRLWYLGLTLTMLAALSGGLYQSLIAHEPQQDPAEHARVIDVFKRNYEKLKENPDVLGVSHYNGKIIIFTDRPDAVPHEVEGVPVELMEPAPHLPPPPGIILLPDDGTHQHLPDVHECPHPYIEERINRWKFCRAPNRARIPGELMHPPIAGVPFQEALAIMKRNAEWIMKVPGVTHTGLGKDWIFVGTSNPELIPSNIEGIPVKIELSTSVGVQSHSTIFPVDPLAGAVAAKHDLSPVGFATIGGIVLSEGKPWAIFPNHANRNCGTPFCEPNDTTPLNACSHNGPDLLMHPPNSNPAMIARLGA